MAHPMGVQDIAGNVSEWTEDCWHQNYMKAPSDGSAWVNPGCSRRVVRGGYWASAPKQSRAAFRISAKPDTYGPVVGFRVARDL
jgi:formylglycine-generating enzyme required for sulfatase activity